MTKDKPGNSSNTDGDGSGGSSSSEGSSEKIVKIVQSTPMPEFSPKVTPWNEWKERLELQFCEDDITEERRKKTMLLRSMGNEAYGLVRTLSDPVLPTDKTYKELCDILEEHYMPPIIIFRERQNFYTAIKGSDESVTDWYAHVKHLALKCKFKDLDEAVRDKFIMGLSNEKQIFEKLCECDDKLTLAEAFRKALLHESKLKGNTMSHEVNFIRGKGKHGNRTAHNAKSTSHTNYSNGNKGDACKHCGWKSHKSAMCKFKDKTCNLCGKKGHLAPICKSKEKKNFNFVNSHEISNSKNQIEENSNANISTFVNTDALVPGSTTRDDGEFSVFSINGTASKTFWLAIHVNGIQFNAKCDTGSPRSLMAKQTFERFFDCNLQKGNYNDYTDYGGHKINILGEFLPSIAYGEQENAVCMIVTDTDTD